MGTFRFAADEPHAGEPGVVIAYAVRHAVGVLLFDTGFGFGNAELDAYYHVESRPIAAAMDDVGIDIADIGTVVNCHLHVDHAGQNGALAGVPTYVQAAEWEIAHTTEHTILDWIDVPGADYRIIDGDHELFAGIRIVATPGHTVGHQSLVIEAADGTNVLAGQAVYSVGEWIGRPGAREGRTRAWDRDAYDRSVERLRALDPARVWFGHDRESWSR
jgi:glyoxylase-like metal-dependent hydrolase (beta-lactamase superfamily II)